jgi:hypothetical protein
MQVLDITTEEFSVEALEERFEMEAVVEPIETNGWVCTCEVDV